MPAIPDEIAEAEEEGIQFRFLIQPVKIESTPNNRLAVTFQRMTLSAPDSSNRPKAIPLKDDFLTLETDSLISAVGELVDLSWIPQNLIKNDLIDAASAPKIFAGGDAVPQSRTIVTAIAAGKKAAISMDYFFRGEAYHEGLSRIRVGKRESISMEAYLQGRENGTWPKAREVVTYQQINPLYFEADKIAKMRKLSRGRRLSSFSEVNLGYDAKKALLAASRCYSCGMCNYCGNCSFFCPEAAISIDPAQGIRAVDYAHCKGCGTCVKACPKCAVEMKNLP